MSDCIAVIGNPESVFVQVPVRHWRRLGVDARIVTASWPAPTVADGLPVISADAIASSTVTRLGDALTPLLGRVDGMIQQHEGARVRTALRSWGERAVLPSLAPPVRDGLLIAAALDVIRPAAVLGHEAFAYGLATQLTACARRSLFVWGADVLHYAHTSDPAFALVGEALRSMRYLLVGSETMQAEVHARFDVPLEAIAVVTYGVDRRQFRRATPDVQRGTRERYGIPADARVVMNLRRFLPHWGAVLAGEVMLDLLRRRPDVHALLLEGAAESQPLQSFLAQAAAIGAGHRVTAVRGQVSLDEAARLMAIADVGLSLVDSFEPLSLSVLQAAACGCQLVIADQGTYRQACAAGLSARLVSPTSSAVADAVVGALEQAGGEHASARLNQRFIASQHDHDAAMLRQLRIVAGEALADRLLAA